MPKTPEKPRKNTDTRILCPHDRKKQKEMRPLNKYPNNPRLARQDRKYKHQAHGTSPQHPNPSATERADCYADTIHSSVRGGCTRGRAEVRCLTGGAVGSFRVWNGSQVSSRGRSGKIQKRLRGVDSKSGNSCRCFTLQKFRGASARRQLSQCAPPAKSRDGRLESGVRLAAFLSTEVSLFYAHSWHGSARSVITARPVPVSTKMGKPRSQHLQHARVALGKRSVHCA